MEEVHIPSSYTELLPTCPNCKNESLYLGTYGNDNILKCDYCGEAFIVKIEIIGMI